MLKQFPSIEAMDDYIDQKIQGSFLIWDSIVLGMYVKRLKAGDKYLELGTQFGKSYASAIFQAPEGVVFFTCDVYDQPHFSDPSIINKKSLSRSEFFAVEGFGGVGDFIESSTLDLAKTWDKGELSMIFIDADHSYEAVKADILAWTPHLKHGGYLLFHDYSIPYFGVKQAVDESVKNSIQFKGFFTGEETYNMKSSIAGAIKI